MAAELPVDNAKQSPGTTLFRVADARYWKLTLTNNDFLYTFRRHGIGRKAVLKVSGEMFKEGCTFEDESIEAARTDYDLDGKAQFSWECAAVSGFCLIYCGYPDVQKIEDYQNEIGTNAIPDYFYVIPKAWVSKDIKQTGQNADLDHYDIYQESGGTFKIHKSRIIRVRLNNQELSLFEPAYNALTVADNILWAVGQTMWRAGQGFPDISVDNPKTIMDENGQMRNEIDILCDKGILRDINSETGFIHDKRVELDFVGAEGKAIRPSEYWTICMENIGASFDVPKDVLVGISAGAVTGSETNLREYYSMLASRQIREVEPIYEAMLERLGFDPESVEFLWAAIYEQSQNEQATTLKTDGEALNSLVSGKIITADEARETIRERHDWLQISDGPIPEEKNPEPLPVLSQIPPPPQQGQQQGQQPTQGVSAESVKAQYAVSDEEVNKRLQDAISEGSALPKRVQIVEKKYMRTVGKAYKGTSQLVGNIFEAFNTDSDEDEEPDDDEPEEKDERPTKHAYIIEPLSGNRTRITEDEA